MEVKRLAKKLRPLLPEQVQRWLNIRQTADADLKDLIDQQIVQAARATLGDYENKPLLSLPPKQKSGGELGLGQILYEQPKWPFGLSRDELLQGMVIFGRSGSGKTNAVFHILKQLHDQSIPFLFLDWKQTGRHMLPKFQGPNLPGVYTAGRSLSPFIFNPFVVPPGLDSHVYINHVVDQLAQAYTLGDGSKSLIQKAIHECYEQGNLSPNPREVLDRVHASPGGSRIKEWKITAVRALESLEFAKLIDSKPKAVVSQEQLAKKLLTQSTFLELDGLTHNSKRFLIPMLCLWLYYAKLATQEREKLDLVIVVEEAHHVLYGAENRANEPAMHMLLRMCREVGIGMVVVDQHARLIASAATANSYTSVCLNQKDPRDLKRAAELSLLEERDKQVLSRLPVGQGVVKIQDRWQQPVLVQFPKMDIAKGKMTDAMLLEYVEHPPKVRRSEAGTGCSRPQASGVGGYRRIPADDRDDNQRGPTSLRLSGDVDEQLRFIEDVLAHPDDGVRRRYARLGFGGSRGHRVRRQLVGHGWLDTQLIPVGNSRKRLLRLSKAGRLALGGTKTMAKPGGYSGGLAHAYWQRYYAQQMKARGYGVRLEAPRPKGVAGQVDVLAVDDERQVAIEIETGKSNAVLNVKNNLRAGLSRVIVVATDKAAYAKVTRQLARAGLLIPGRVWIVLAGDKSPQ